MENSVKIFYQQIKPNQSKILASAIKHILHHQNPDFYTPTISFKKKEPLQEFLSGKRKILFQSLEDIVGLIKQREEMRDINTDQIDKEICYVHTKIMNLPRQKYSFNKDVEKTYNSMVQQSLMLYQAKRDEEINCWKDILRLKTDLRESVSELEQEKRKQNLIKGAKPW
jgi:hypothetical protein